MYLGLPLSNQYISPTSEAKDIREYGEGEGDMDREK